MLNRGIARRCASRAVTDARNLYVAVSVYSILAVLWYCGH